ncbi:MAG TPA: hypothetical protein VHI52_01055, partial [Verrucomicrobiae bacterium]|nr:hypothetical protein [Verrucomicrobiae bacterium]
NSAQRKTLRTRLLEVNAFCWLASRARLKVAGVWVFLAFVACWWVYMRLWAGMNWTDEPFSLTTALLLNSVIKIWVGIEAGQCLAEEQKMGTLELLLSTPLGEREIVRGQLLALKRQFLKPLAAVVAVEVVFMFLLSRYSFVSTEQSGKQLAFGIAGLVLLALDLPALIGVALVSALKSKTPNQASVNTITRILILPWIVFAAVASLASFWTVGGTDLGWEFYLHLWFWLGVVTDLAFGLPAWLQVRTRFRELALRRVTASHGKPQPNREVRQPARVVVPAIDY